jgi:hypothetical protein
VANALGRAASGDDAHDIPKDTAVGKDAQVGSEAAQDDDQGHPPKHEILGNLVTNAVEEHHEVDLDGPYTDQAQDQADPLAVQAIVHAWEDCNRL